MRAQQRPDLVRRHALPRDLRGGVRPEVPVEPSEGASAASPRGSSTACSRVGADIGEPHAIGREQARQRMDEDRRHAERVGDEAGMLAAGAAEAIAAHSA